MLYTFNSPCRSSYSNAHEPELDGDAYFIPVAGGLMEPGDESDVPGGAPVLIEEVFKRYHQDRLKHCSNSPNTPPLEEAGIWWAPPLFSSSTPFDTIIGQS